MNIVEVQLLTDDLEQTRRFYHEIVGLKTLSRNNEMISFSAGHSLLTFHKSDNDNPVYHFAFNIPSNQLEAAIAWADSKFDLIEISSSKCIADFKSWNAKAFYFYDNNKNIVEMIARFDLDNASNRVFDGSSVYSISEIGIVVNNPRAYTGNLLANYGLQFFSKQKPADDFIAVGDDTGLFIIVSEDRNWYPTDIRSSRHWTKISIALPGGIKEITLPQ